MSEQESEKGPQGPDTESTTATETPIVETDEYITKCDACKTAVEITCVGIIVGGVILAAPEELTIAAIVTALAGLGLAFGADEVRKWITQAAKEGINNIEQLAKYICKQAGVC